MVLVAYDIRNDSFRTKAMKRLLAMGFQRLQKSVYFKKGGRGDALDAFRAIKKYVKDETDKIFVVTLSDKEFREALVLEGVVG
ncbi:CRISPR-associated endonuclease Cas2 [Ignicoccus islandicus]|uniref:CRISPR-associated endonuclease Cas2 n=1 Tax=Ignicoccus islandicus TaxID=54259 RepID=UPI000946873F|nr:CRISPR-associated endonuclease Cas2 [Ignicoccus islandicus]